MEEPICSNSLAMRWMGQHRPQNPDAQSSTLSPTAPRAGPGHQMAINSGASLVGFWNFPIALSTRTVGIPEMAKLPSRLEALPSSYVTQNTHTISARHNLSP